MILRFSLILTCLCLGACERSVVDTPQQAWERAMTAYGDHNYGALWEMLSSESQADTMRVLEHVQSDPDYRESMRVKFQIPNQFLDAMPPRDFFAALMSAADRKHPAMLERRAKSASEAVFTRAEIKADRAIVFWTSPVSGAEKMVFVLEHERWKPVLKR